jgi:hypothetical protein
VGCDQLAGIEPAAGATQPAFYDEIVGVDQHGALVGDDVVEFCNGFTRSSAAVQVPGVPCCWGALPARRAGLVQHGHSLFRQGLGVGDDIEAIETVQQRNPPERRDGGHCAVGPPVSGGRHEVD